MLATTHNNEGNTVTNKKRILLVSSLFMLPFTFGLFQLTTALLGPKWGYVTGHKRLPICHGTELNGGPFPDPTITKISPNLTPGGEVGFWSEEDFINTLRTGTTPGGHPLDPEFMPWPDYAVFYDDELKAIYAYLQSLPKLEQYTE